MTFLIPWPRITRGKNAGKWVDRVELNSRVHWRTTANRALSLRVHVHQHARSVRARARLEPATEPRVLRLILLRGKRQQMLDRDAVFCALKPACDGLRDAGWIVDDAEKWCDYDAQQHRAENGEAAILVQVSTPTWVASQGQRL